MSIKSWLEEFYPTPAEECSKKSAIDHSLRKWEGLLPENLEKHGVEIGKEAVIHEIGSACTRITFGNGDCALCVIYRHFERVDDDFVGTSECSECSECPLYKTRNKPCWRGDSPTNFFAGSPWDQFNEQRNPMPMIEALRLTKKLAEEGPRKEK